CAYAARHPFHNVWLAGTVSTWWMGGAESQAAVRTSAKTRWQKAQVDLRHGDAKEPAAAQVPICLVDARDGGHADQGQIQHLVEPGLGRTAFGATRHHLPAAAASRVGTRRGAGAAMAQAGLSEDQSACAAGEGRDLLRRRRASALGSSFRPHLGKKGETPV